LKYYDHIYNIKYYFYIHFSCHSIQLGPKNISLTCPGQSCQSLQATAFVEWIEKLLIYYIISLSLLEVSSINEDKKALVTLVVTSSVDNQSEPPVHGLTQHSRCCHFTFEPSNLSDADFVIQYTYSVVFACSLLKNGVTVGMIWD